jgi:hypothetical protein
MAHTDTVNSLNETINQSIWRVGSDPDQADRNASGQVIEWPPLTKDEVERAVFRSNPDKAPGSDEITFRV